MKAFKALIKPFQVPQRRVKIKIYTNFTFNTTSEIHGVENVLKSYSRPSRYLI